MVKCGPTCSDISLCYIFFFFARRSALKNIVSLVEVLIQQRQSIASSSPSLCVIISFRSKMEHVGMWSLYKAEDGKINDNDVSVWIARNGEECGMGEEHAENVRWPSPVWDCWEMWNPYWRNGTGESIEGQPNILLLVCDTSITLCLNSLPEEGVGGWCLWVTRGE